MAVKVGEVVLVEETAGEVVLVEEAAGEVEEVVEIMVREVVRVVVM